MELVIIMVVSVLVAGLLLWGITKPTLKKLGLLHVGSYRPFSPNWITLYSTLFGVVGTIAYFTGSPICGFVLVVVGGVLDRLDGKMAFVLNRTLSLPSTWKVAAGGELLAIVTTLEYHEVKDEIEKPRKGLFSVLIAPLRWVVRLFRKKKTIITKSYSVEVIVPSVIVSTRFPKLSLWWVELWAEFNFSGGTDLGEVLDPFSDKAKSLPLMTLFGFLGFLSPWLVGISWLPELFGTAIRRPFFILKRLFPKPKDAKKNPSQPEDAEGPFLPLPKGVWGVCFPMPKDAEEHLIQSKATGVGKFKVTVQWITIILCAPYHQHWIGQGHWAFGLDWVPNSFLGLSILFALASVASRFKRVQAQKEVKGFSDFLGESASHE